MRAIEDFDTRVVKPMVEGLEKKFKDYGIIMVGKRKRLLSYLKNKDINRYKKVIKELGLRK